MDVCIGSYEPMERTIREIHAMNWIPEEEGFRLTVPIELWPGEDGEYQIHIIKRPHYCDRGDWVFVVDGINDLDYSDGFPRYFFGTAEEAQQQMQLWINKRAAHQKWLQRSLNT
jgi:hypothetical protein